jgi:hypothetical protein
MPKPTHHKFTLDHHKEFDEVFVTNASVHIERMSDRCYWMCIDPPEKSGLPSLRIFTGVGAGKWFFRISEDALEGAQKFVTDRPAKYVNKRKGAGQ